MAELKDVTNKKFGRWTVLEDNGGGKILVLCQCGTKRMVSKYNITNGHSKGCGCVKSKPGNVGLYLLHYSYKARSKRRGIDFLLTKDELKKITSQNCFYCGRTPLQIIKNHYKSKVKSRGTAASDNTKYLYNGIDRVDNDKGYTIENSVPCCSHCNFAKLNMTQGQFMDLITNIYNNWVIKNKKIR